MYDGQSRQQFPMPEEGQTQLFNNYTVDCNLLQSYIFNLTENTTQYPSFLTVSRSMTIG